MVTSFSRSRLLLLHASSPLARHPEWNLQLRHYQYSLPVLGSYVRTYLRAFKGRTRDGPWSTTKGLAISETHGGLTLKQGKSFKTAVGSVKQVSASLWWHKTEESEVARFAARCHRLGPQLADFCLLWVSLRPPE